ncbi:MAG TPA: ergothioneine biosynthesis protein EgtB [Acidimicrobiia bacterium]|nr:ergothioneine biosynthesis protein EgtB [Acidimicrobiia bacterium]
MTTGVAPVTGIRERVASELDAARRRTLALLEPVSDGDLLAQHSPLMSPLVWDLAHIAHYEELWLVRTLTGAPPTDARFDDVYDAFRHPRRERPSLDILGPADARAFARDVRTRVLDVLATVDLDRDELLRNAFVYGMVVQHEHQHDETMLATLQLRDATYPFAEPAPRSAVRDVDGEVLVEGGPFVMGTSTEPWAYDNERPAHVVDVPSFLIDRAPVTNAAYAEFVADRGYDDPRWWTAAGWAWRVEADLHAPQFWRRDGSGWARRRFGTWEPVPPDEPVQHVCWYEADAYARWAGKRLPTEPEWEKAASWDPGAGRARSYPWGDGAPTPARANLGQARLGPEPVGSRADGASAYGCEQMIGDVWEWTSTDFGPHPGFVSFPYREYSEVFFGSEYKVLRGGSWATHVPAVRTTFRNWDYPIRRQIFAGFRCARDMDIA